LTLSELTDWRHHCQTSHCCHACPPGLLQRSARGSPGVLSVTATMSSWHNYWCYIETTELKLWHVTKI